MIRVQGIEIVNTYDNLEPEPKPPPFQFQCLMMTLLIGGFGLTMYNV